MKKRLSAFVTFALLLVGSASIYAWDLINSNRAYSLAKDLCLKAGGLRVTEPFPNASAEIVLLAEAKPGFDPIEYLKRYQGKRSLVVYVLPYQHPMSRIPPQVRVSGWEAYSTQSKQKVASYLEVGLNGRAFSYRVSRIFEALNPNINSSNFCDAGELGGEAPPFIFHERSLIRKGVFLRIKRS